MTLKDCNGDLPYENATISLECDRTLFLLNSFVGNECAYWKKGGFPPVAIFFTLILLSLVVVILFKRQQIAHPTEGEVELPDLSATVHLLTPFFSYGIVYFCFIFAQSHT